MGENLKYIYDFLNRKSSTLSFYVTRINQIYDTENNNSIELTNYVKRIIELINEISEIMRKMGIHTLPINSFCNQLKLLDIYGIPEATYFLKNCNYEQTYTDELGTILKQIKNDESLSEESILLIEFLINNHLVPQEYKEDILEFFIRRTLLKQKLISYDTFENLIVDWTKMQMSMYLDSFECYVVNESELDKKLGYAFQDTIYLNRNDIAEMYNTGFFRLIKTIYHELVHVMQYKLVKIDGKNSPLLLKEIKDEILSHLIPSYYEENYEKISYEAEAEFLSIYSMLKLFSKFGIQFSKGINPYLETLQRLEAIINSDDRLIEGESISLSELFEYKITNYPEYLEIYPQLNTEFHVAFEDLVISNDEYGSR